MSAEKHTPGRCACSGIRTSGKYTGCLGVHPASERGGEGPDFILLPPGREDVQRANARRIVAVWNACEGIPAEDLEACGRVFPIKSAPQLNAFARETLEVSDSKGFVNPTAFVREQADLILSKLMLVTSGVAEACEAVRQGDQENFAEELADVVIRVCNLSAALGIDLDKAVQDKHERNKARPMLHGGKWA